ncbi:MAG: hypothetical protein ACODAU_07635 [Myxococcota bacterium]
MEGHGEQEAVLNLLYRVEAQIGTAGAVWAPPIRVRQLSTSDGLERLCNRVRLDAEAAGLLILRDEDDGCPATIGPDVATFLRGQRLPFPAAVVLAHREFESLFLASMKSIVGRPLPGPGGHARPGWPENAIFLGNPESKRGAKEWLSAQLPRGRKYKPSVDQLPLMQMVDLDLVRESGLAWFGTLERALRFLTKNAGTSGAVYPPPATHG